VVGDRSRHVVQPTKPAAGPTQKPLVPGVRMVEIEEIRVDEADSARSHPRDPGFISCQTIGEGEMK
jgi:hypothetical protein